METISLRTIFELLTNFGTVGIVAVMWYFDVRSLRKQHSDHKDEVAKILAAYAKDMDETRRMYEHNVDLVKDYGVLARDLKDIIVLNTRQMTKLSEEICQNQFCPQLRVKKEIISVEAKSHDRTT